MATNDNTNSKEKAGSEMSFLVLIDPSRGTSSQELLFGLQNLAEVLEQLHDDLDDAGWMAQITLKTFTKLLVDRRLDDPDAEKRIRDVLADADFEE